MSPTSTNGGSPGFGLPVEDADHRRLDGDEPADPCPDRRRAGLLQGERRAVRDRGRRGRLVAAPHGDAEVLLLDRHLGDTGLLDDPDDLADPLRPVLVDAAGGQPLVACGAAADRLEQRLGVVAEEREQQQLLLARGQPARLRAQLLERRRRLRLVPLRGEQLHGTLDDRVDLPRRRAVASEHEIAQLVHDDAPALRGEDVEQRLRCEHLPDRRGERRHPTSIRTRASSSSTSSIRSAARVRAQVRVEARDEAGRERELRGANGDPRRERDHGLVADVLVDELGGAPERLDVDARVHRQARRAPAASDSLETRCRVSATGYAAAARRSAPARAASIAHASAAPPAPWK